MDANTFGLMSAGFANALMPSNLIMMIIGVTIGIVVGCMPVSYTHLTLPTKLEV